MVFRIAQDDPMEAVLDCADDTNSRRLRGLKEGATFGEAIMHFFRDERAGRREFLVRDHLNKAHAAKQMMAEIKAWAGTADLFPLGGRRVLDVGCGTGGTALALAELGADVHGVDIDRSYLKLAALRFQASGLRAELRRMNVLKMDYPDASFDFIFCSQVLEHVCKWKLLLAELIRILRPAGYAYLDFPNRLSPREVHCGYLGVSYLPNWLARLYLCLRGHRPWRLVHVPWQVWHVWPWAVIREVSRWPGSILHSSFPSPVDLAASLRESPLRVLRVAGGSMLRQDTVRVLFRKGGVTTHAHRILEQRG